MKKPKSIIGVIIALIVGIVYVSQTYLGIDLIGYINPDETNPVIDVSGLNATVSVNSTFNTDVVTCTDNRDTECEVNVYGSVDTSILGEQQITFSATDMAGNNAQVVVVITVIEGLNTAMFVPAGYYDGIDGLTGEALKDALNDIITNHTEFPYTHNSNTDVWDLLRDADEDPENTNNVLMFYSGFSWPKDCQDTTTASLPDECFENNDREADYTEWNREHIWSKSHGDFEEEDDYVFEEKSGGYALGAHTDGHHLVAAERRMNSIKNNRFFDDCHDGIDDDNLEDRGFGNYTCGEWYFEPRDEVKGDVARMLFYMVIRYEGEDGDYVDLELATDPEALDLINHIKDSKLPIYGKLAILLQWHLDDPVDQWEINRNEAIYQFQGNRNPFIDHPELVELIWGTPSNPVDYYTN